MTEQEQPVVLIAEDEPSVAEGYELWLSGDYEVRLATDGQEALEMVDDSVDVVLLDRMMPEFSGKQVLREIRERNVNCRVAKVTAVEPDFDVVEMGFDAYITKPPDREPFLDTIEQLLDRATVGDSFQTYHSLMARKGALEAQKSAEELAESEEYQDLLDRIESQRADIDEDLGDMGSGIDFVSAVRGVEDEDSDFEDIDIDDGADLASEEGTDE